MRTLERIGFLFILCCTVALLNRAGAQDGLSGMSEVSSGDTAGGTPISTSRLEITAPDGRVVMRLGVTPEGGGRIQLLNKLGKTVVQLSARTDDDGEIVLADDRGVLRTRVGGDATGGYANFYGKSGKRGLYVGTSSTRDAGFISLFEGGKKRVSLSTHDKGGQLYVYNNTDKAVLVAAAGSDTGAGFFSSCDAQGKLGLQLYTSQHGGQVVVKNPKGKQAAFLGCSSAPTGNGLLIVARDDGQRLAEIGRTSKHGGYLAVRNGNNKQVAFLGASNNNSSANEGTLELSRHDGQLGVLCRAYRGGAGITVYDSSGKVRKQLR